MINLEIKHRRVRRARHLRLSISADGRVLLTRPFWVSEKKALNFLESKKVWLEEKWQELQMKPDNYFRRGGRLDYLKYKETARALVVAKIEHFNSLYKFSFSRISIRDQRSRWGSCSKNGGLNFNYRLVFLPEELLDYLVVHELCHLGELNHSPAFWRLVERSIPDYSRRRRALRLS
jgi:predicted metal-dependent hydrolase